MVKFSKIFFSGLSISLLGTLPLGTLNLTSLEISASQGVYQGVLFALAVVLVELVAVKFTLVAANKVDLNHRIFFYLMPTAICFLLYLAIYNFLQYNITTVALNGTNTISGIESTFLLGLLLSSLNPLQLPFWFSWNSVLLDKKTLDMKTGSQVSYLMGIGSGTLSGLLVFIFLGSYVFQYYSEYANFLTLLLGLLYLAFSLYLIFLYYRRHLKPKMNL